MQHPPPISFVTVYCSSSTRLAPEYHREAKVLGEGLARSGRGLVYGGGKVGLMGEVAKSCRDAGGRVIGIITHRLRDAEQMDPDNHETLVVATMRERKALLESHGDAMVVLPGGLGTLEEFFEILVGRLLGEHTKPIIIVNPPDPDALQRTGQASRFYDPLLEMVDHLIAGRFANPGVRTLFHVRESAEDALALLDDPAKIAGPSDDELWSMTPSGLMGQRPARSHAKC